MDCPRSLTATPHTHTYTHIYIVIKTSGKKMVPSTELGTVQPPPSKITYCTPSTQAQLDAAKLRLVKAERTSNAAKLRLVKAARTSDIAQIRHAVLRAQHERTSDIAQIRHAVLRAQQERLELGLLRARARRRVLGCIVRE